MGGSRWLVIVLALAGLGLQLTRGRFAGLGFLTLGFALVVAGLLAGGSRNATVSAPVLDFRYYGPVEGRIVKIDRSSSDATRLTLDRLRLDRVAPAKMPERVRVSLHGDQPFLNPIPGQRIAVTAFLSGPEGPALLVGFMHDVTPQKGAEEEHAWELHVNTALAELGNALIQTDRAIQEVAANVFECAKGLTGSAHGYVSEIEARSRRRRPRSSS